MTCLIKVWIDHALLNAIAVKATSMMLALLLQKPSDLLNLKIIKLLLKEAILAGRRGIC